MQIVEKDNIPNILEIRIDRLSNLGFGIAKLNGYVIFVPNTCPEDVVRVKVDKRNKNYAYGSIIEIITPSPHRVQPFCKMQNVCGACQLQFIDYHSQLKYKKEIVEDTMRKIFGSEIEVRDVVPSPQIKEYRHKIQYPISQTKESKRIIAGYYKPSSHDLINIKYCPIQPEYCDKIIDFIRENAQKLNVSGYIEKEHKGLLRHVVIRTSSLNKKSLVVLVINSCSKNANVENFAKLLFNNLDNISGVCVNYNSNKTNLILGEKTDLIIGKDYVEEALCDKVFKIGVKTFFQVNPKSANNIFNYIKNYIKTNCPNSSIIDAYAGISAFGICLSDIASNVTTVEETKESVDIANTLLKENNINNVSAYCEDAGSFLQKLATSGTKFDITVVDPPRKGCTKESLDYALKLTKRKIIYVSCNPATLARDLKYLKDQGATIEYIQPFDMFPHTYHIENIAIISL